MLLCSARTCKPTWQGIPSCQLVAGKLTKTKMVAQGDGNKRETGISLAAWL